MVSEMWGGGGCLERECTPVSGLSEICIKYIAEYTRYIDDMMKWLFFLAFFLSMIQS